MFKLSRSEPTLGGANTKSNAKLEGYEEVMRQDWLDIELNTYIRYEKNDGVLTKGGFIFSKSIERNTLSLRSDLHSYNSASWQVQLDNISTIWRKKSSSNDIDGNNETLQRIIKQLHSRLSVLESNNDDDNGVDRMSAEILQLRSDYNDLKHDIKEIYNYLESLNKFISGTNEK